MAKLTKKELLAAYKELDKVIGGLEPAIEFVNEKQFSKEMHEVIIDPELVTPEDKFSKTTKAVFNKLKEMHEEEEEEAEELEEEEEAEEEEEEEDEEEEEAPPVKKGKKAAPAKKGKKVSKPEPEPEEEEDEEEEEEEDTLLSETIEEEEEEDEEKTLLSETIEEAEEDDDLKTILKENKDLFKGFKAKEFKGFKKLKKAMLTFIEPAPVTKEKSVKAEKVSKGTGVIAAIATIIADSGKKGVSKEEILNQLEKLFPNREAKSMKNTINVQIPNRMSKERFQIVKLENGNFAKK